MTDEFPEPRSARPVWLMTLADLALLLLGFFILVQATRAADRPALARSVRAGFGASAPALPVAAARLGFAPGSATPDGADALAAWVAEQARDPRVRFTLAAATDGTAADVDPATGSAALLAADRARAAALLVARTAPRARVVLATSSAPERAVTVTLAFAGEP